MHAGALVAGIAYASMAYMHGMHAAEMPKALLALGLGQVTWVGLQTGG